VAFVDFDFYADRSLRGHGLKLKVQRGRLQLRQGFFRHRIVKIWNMLPASVGGFNREDI